MKNFLLSFTAFAIIFTSSICFAEVLKDVSLGGIRLGMSYQEVISMYGEPSLKYERLDSQGRVWEKFIEYGGTVQVTFSAKKGDFGVVKNVFVTANNGFALPSGIKVGSKKSDFLKIYGDVNNFGKGRYGLYYKVKISKNEVIVFSTNDISNTDIINSLQISNTEATPFEFEKQISRPKNSGVQLRDIK